MYMIKMRTQLHEHIKNSDTWFTFYENGSTSNLKANMFIMEKEDSDGIISALSSDPHTPTFNRNSTCLTFQTESTFMLFYNPFLFLFRLAKSNFKNITPSYRYLQLVTPTVFSNSTFLLSFYKNGVSSPLEI